ncbi:tetratricopeptide repeat protein [uncultured Paludibaculum sp.]|uniref:tetratricopeptide repeat protein n=1 Tax=uncultured Paludibaculum sp. TaxID=1765020 RepID=UPI002AAB57EA|nr:tetratricopeptide repeat protein [uncultured Paludibaculum sp.]
MNKTFFASIVLFTTVAFAATPAETAIQKAQAGLAAHPDHVPYLNSLAMAYARRARETSDVSYYAKADETLRRSFTVSPNNFEGLKVEAWLQLGRHEFAKALATAKGLNKQMPDDISVYGYLVDANVELGHYADAVKAAQWMLDLKPGNVAGLTRAAYLRELHGRLPGALQLMQSAYDSTPFPETEDRAWLLTQLAHLHFISGDLSQAEMYASGALGLFSNYHYAQAALARVRSAQNRHEEAAALLRQRYEVAPHAENLYAWAEELELAGHKDEAAKAFAQFERMSLAESGQGDNSNHELIAYYIDHARQPAKALEIARREMERRQDVFTRDCYAWALAANGEYEQADSEIQKALQIGVKEPRLLYHAGAIAHHLNRPEKAALYLKDAAAGHSSEAAALQREQSQTAAR